MTTRLPVAAATDQATPLARLLRPASVAVVGASPNHRWGRIMLANLRTIGYPGAVAAVNPNHEAIDGVPCYPTIGSIPTPPDAVLVGVGRDRVLSVIEECVEAGVGGAVVVAAGFAEAGPAGRELQDRLARVAGEANLPVIGPNCMGLINVSQPCALYLDLVRAPLSPGPVAFLAHSGTVVQALANNLLGVRFSFVVSAGNEAVTGAPDLIEYFAEDETTRVIVAFLEAVREPERFLAACDLAGAAGKPVVVLKTGRSEGAREAALAHSGALATPDRLIDALFRHHGVLRVDSLEELLSTAAVLLGRRPTGQGVAAMTQSGGQVGLMADAAAEVGVDFTVLQPRTVAELESRLAPSARVSNPLDAWGLGETQDKYASCLAALASDTGVSLIAQVIEGRTFPTGESESLDATLAAVEEVAAGTDKPIVFVSSVSGDVDPAVQERLAASGVPVLAGIRLSLRAIERTLAFHEFHRSTRARRPPELDRDAVLSALHGLGGEPLSGLPALRLVAAMGIPVAETALGRAEADAVEAAEAIGFPVVLKTADPRILHKTDAAPLFLDLRDADAVRNAFRRLAVVAELDGTALVQEYVGGGLELIVGLHTEPSLGTFVIAGLGGVWAEALDDVSVRPVDLRTGEALEMLGELRAAELLRGARGAGRVSLPALVEIVERLAAAGELIGDRIRSLDINPLILLPNGAAAVDAVLVPTDG